MDKYIVQFGRLIVIKLFMCCLGDFSVTGLNKTSAYGTLSPGPIIDIYFQFSNGEKNMKEKNLENNFRNIFKIFFKNC